MSQQQQQQSAIDGCFREMRHPRPSPKKQKKKKERKNLRKKKENCNILFSTFLAQNAKKKEKETSQLARKITRYAIYDEATIGNINPFVLLQAHRNAHLVVTEAESRGDHKGTSGHLERLLPGTSRRANPLARAGCRIFAWGASPQCRLSEVAGLESLPGLIIAFE